MIKSAMIAVFAVGFMVSATHAEQTTAEKATATKNDVKRAAKKDWHKVQEAVCAEGDVECAAKKAKHRTQESTEYLKDKAEEGVDKVD